MKRTIGKAAPFVLLAAWAALIFCFSAQPEDASSEVSGTAAYRLVELADELCGWELSEPEQLSYAEQIEFPVRKAAHMTEYAVFAILACVCAGTLSVTAKHRFLSAFLLAVCYAATDEFHQLFVPGRAGRCTDVCIDAAGAVIGLLLFALARKIVRKIQNIACKKAFGVV